MTDMPRPKTRGELLKVIDKATSEATDYNAAAEAMVTCSVAAFNYAANAVGATGFQAGYAALSAYGKVMAKEGPFAVIDGNDLLYPQYNIEEKVNNWLNGWMEWASEEAAKRLKEDGPVHPEVRRRWERLAAGISYDELKKEGSMR